MRRFSLFLLLAATAVPALAQSDEARGRGLPGADRAAEAGGDRESYRRDAGRAERPAVARQEERVERAERQRPDRGQRPAQSFEGQREAQAPAQFDRRGDDGARGSGRRRGGHDGQQGFDRSRLPSQQDARQSRGWQQRDRRVRTIPDGNVVAAPVGMTSPERPVSSAERRRYDRDGRGGHGWNQRWRNDARYDWRRYRDRNRSTFRLGFYYDPFGYNYRRFGIGSYMWPSYFGSRYWINDPWRYRLPPAYGPYRWVRYHNDALLIDTWTGQVVDVIYGFFW